MENQSRFGVLVQLIALLAFEIGVENKTARIMTFQQHHARIGHAIRADRRQRHRIGVVRLAFGGLLQPIGKSGNRVGRYIDK